MLVRYVLILSVAVISTAAAMRQPGFPPAAPQIGQPRVAPQPQAAPGFGAFQPLAEQAQQFMQGIQDRVQRGNEFAVVLAPLAAQYGPVLMQFIAGLAQGGQAPAGSDSDSDSDSDEDGAQEAAVPEVQARPISTILALLNRLLAGELSFDAINQQLEEIMLQVGQTAWAKKLIEKGRQNGLAVVDWIRQSPAGHFVQSYLPMAERMFGRAMFPLTDDVLGDNFTAQHFSNAAYTGDLEIVQHVVTTYPRLIDAFENGYTPVIWAAFGYINTGLSQAREVFSYLLSQGANYQVSIENGLAKTPFARYLRQKKFDTVKKGWLWNGTNPEEQAKQDRATELVRLIDERIQFEIEQERLQAAEENGDPQGVDLAGQGPVGGQAPGHVNPAGQQQPQQVAQKQPQVEEESTWARNIGLGLTGAALGAFALYWLRDRKTAQPQEAAEKSE
jgi:hypothetical protein